MEQLLQRVLTVLSDFIAREKRMISVTAVLDASDSVEKIIQAPAGFRKLKFVYAIVNFTGAVFEHRISLYDQSSQVYIMDDLVLSGINVQVEGIPIDKSIMPENKFTVKLTNHGTTESTLSATLAFEK